MVAVQSLPSTAAAPALGISYQHVDAARALDRPGMLAVIAFGAAPHVHGDPRLLRVPLTPLGPQSPGVECWQVSGPVARGGDAQLSWSSGGGYLMVALRIDEAVLGGIQTAAAHAYRQLLDTLAAHGYPHLLRAWNYLADINAGDGDAERYRHFTIGRADGMAGLAPGSFPAATAIGRLDGVRELVVYALAARSPGQPVENPRQVSAYRYPRQYGPVPPSFARAMRIDTQPPMLLISGTASVVGHASLHECPAAQIQETLLNLDSLAASAGMDTAMGGRPCLKVYVRSADDIDVVRTAMTERGFTSDQVIYLHGDICRLELLLEIDGAAQSCP